MSWLAILWGRLPVFFGKTLPWDYLAEYGVVPKFVKVIEMTDAIIELIASGFGVGILSRWALEPALENNRVVALRVSPDGLDLRWSALIREGQHKDTPSRKIAGLLAERYQWIP